MVDSSITISNVPSASSVPDSVLNQVLMDYQVESQKRSVLAETPQRIIDAARPYIQLGGDVKVLHDAIDSVAPSPDH